MQTFEELSKRFAEFFSVRHFPSQPATLYEADEYFLGLGGKRVRPVLCLMGNELFDDIHPYAWNVASAIELFHNFTLIHDDIMDRAPLRRGMPTVHARFGEATALLAGDVMLVVAYDHLNKIRDPFIHRILQLFNKTAREVCEGQQLDMDFEKMSVVDLPQYIHMIGLKTSVLLAASLQMGAILGGAGRSNQENLYQFGKNLGIAFQIQDDYLDAFGDPARFGKQPGGDIMANKKTFLMIRALEQAEGSKRAALEEIMKGSHPDKVAGVLQIFRDCGIDRWAKKLKTEYLNKAFGHLEEIAVTSIRKQPLEELAHYLVKRDH